MGLAKPKPLGSGERRVLWVRFYRGARRVGEVASPDGRVRWGPSVGIEFAYPVPGVEEREDLFLPGGRLVVRPGMEGEIRAGRSLVALEDLGDLGLLEGGRKRRWVRITPAMEGSFTYRDLRVEFGYGPPPELSPAARLAKVPRRFRRGVLSREEWPFAVFTWLLYGGLALLCLRLGSVEVPPAPKPEAVSQRFAKLIYEAPQERTRIQQELLAQKRAEEAKAEAPAPEPEKAPEPEPKPEEKPPEPEAKPEPKPEAETPAPEPKAPAAEPAQAEAPKPEAPPGPPGPAGPSKGPSREEIRRKVAKQGLLGLLSGRGRASVSRRKGSVLEGAGAAADLDKVLEKVEGLEAAPPAGGGGGGGGTGPAVDTGIDEAAQRVAAAPEPAELEAPEEEQVEAPQEEGWDEVTLREILAELHRAVGAYLGGLRYLYNRALRKNPDLEGKFTVRMTVGPDGKIQEVEVVESTLGDPDLERALLARIRKWTLPAVADRPVTVTYPFVFFPSM
ncbi:TonB family protein [Deferrisoma sp.]